MEYNSEKFRGNRAVNNKIGVGQITYKSKIFSQEIHKTPIPEAPSLWFLTCYCCQ